MVHRKYRLLRGSVRVDESRTERSLLMSFYEIRVYGPCELVAPQLTAYLFRIMNLEDAMIGPTAAVVDPVAHLLVEIC